jgi:hypothetical protein
MGVVESGASGPRRDAEDPGDLGRGVAIEVVEHEDRALLRGEATEPAVQLVAIGEGDEGVRRGRSFDRQDAQVRGSPPLPCRVVDAFANEQAMEPGVESIRIT